MPKSSPANKSQSLKTNPVRVHSYDPRATYASASIIWGILMYVLASWAIDSGNLFVYAFTFIAVYLFTDNLVKMIKAIVKKEHLVRPSEKRKKA